MRFDFVFSPWAGMLWARTKAAKKWVAGSGLPAHEYGGEAFFATHSLVAALQHKGFTVLAHEQKDAA